MQFDSLTKFVNIFKKINCFLNKYLPVRNVLDETIKKKKKLMKNVLHLKILLVIINNRILFDLKLSYFLIIISYYFSLNIH